MTGRHSPFTKLKDAFGKVVNKASTKAKKVVKAAKAVVKKVNKVVAKKARTVARKTKTAVKKAKNKIKKKSNAKSVKSTKSTSKNPINKYISVETKTYEGEAAKKRIVKETGNLLIGLGGITAGVVFVAALCNPISAVAALATLSSVGGAMAGVAGVASFAVGVNNTVVSVSNIHRMEKYKNKDGGFKVVETPGISYALNLSQVKRE